MFLPNDNLGNLIVWLPLDILYPIVWMELFEGGSIESKMMGVLYICQWMPSFDPVFLRISAI